MLKSDFKILHPMMVSEMRISRFFGEVVGRPDNICQNLFNNLYTPDPYDPIRLMKDNFVFVVDPCLIKRSTIGMALPRDSNGNLIDLPAGIVRNGNELMISFTLRHQIELSRVPLEKIQGDRQAFRDIDYKIIDQCDVCPNKVKVYFMRRFMVDKSQLSAYSACKTYQEQEAGLLEKGFGVAPIRVRCLFNSVEIFESGTSPDVQLATYVRCSETVTIGNDEHHACIGDFGYRYGAGIMADNQTYDESGYGMSCIDFGVVPCISAEAVKPLDNGH